MKLLQKISLVLAILTAIFIFYISSLEFPPNPLPSIGLVPILYHFGIFSLFAFLVAFTLQGSYIFALIFSSVYAGLDELHQFFVPGRSCAFSDFGLDFFGCIIGIVVCAVIFLIFKKKN